METKLLPCPFCGESYIDIIKYEHYIVSCDSCECSMGYYDTEDEAIEAWNTRHERTCQIEGTYSDEFAIYDHLTCGHVNLRHWHEPTSYCSTCGARVKEDTDANN